MAVQNLSGQYTIDRGSASAPGWSFNGITTSGMFGKSDGSLGFSVLGKEILNVGSTDVKYSANVSSTVDGVYNIGSNALRFRAIYLALQPIIISDISYKSNVRDLSEAEMRAWSKVSPKIYNLMDSPLNSSGMIAQDIIKAFHEERLDIELYSLLVLDENQKYMMSYGEASIFEAAYQRQRANELERRLDHLSRRIDGIVQSLNLGGV